MILNGDTSEIQNFPRLFLIFLKNEKHMEIQKFQKESNSKYFVKIFGFLDFCSIYQFLLRALHETQTECNSAQYRAGLLLGTQCSFYYRAALFEACLVVLRSEPRFCDAVWGCYLSFVQQHFYWYIRCFLYVLHMEGRRR